MKQCIAMLWLLLITACTNYNEEELYPAKADCGTFAISYAQTVRPILERACISCHTGNFGSGSIALETYAGVKQAANGPLLPSIKHAAGYTPMPLGDKLPACDIAKIQAWVDAGAPNN